MDFWNARVADQSSVVVRTVDLDVGAHDFTLFAYPTPEPSSSRLRYPRMLAFRLRSATDPRPMRLGYSWFDPVDASAAPVVLEVALGSPDEVPVTAHESSILALGLH
jgi:hypothetical protein